MSEQSLVNAAFWTQGSDVEGYANRSLSAAEATILIRYRDAFARRVLELGCGAGRLTGYILAIGGELLGTDIAPAMIEYCRRAYPAGTFVVADLRALEPLDGLYDVVLAGNNLLDVLDHETRRDVLGWMRGVVAPGGLLVMSAHNRAHAPRIPTPLGTLLRDGWAHALPRLHHAPLWIANRRRLSRHEQREPDYAVINDEAHDYRLLHYYIDRDAQAQQLAEAGFEVIECIDRDGRIVEPGEHAPESSELYYVARAGA